MVDKAIYLSSDGADTLMQRVEVLVNNLANASTPGFRADFPVIKPVPVGEGGNISRVYSSVSGTWSDFSKGPVTGTGRDLDVALESKGYIAVQSASGKEGYTRAGNLHLLNGVLVTAGGHLVIGSGGGVISVPEQAERLSIAADGSVSVKLKGVMDPTVVGRIKLVNPPDGSLHKGTDGLIYPVNEGVTVEEDEKVRLIPGALEGSNVNTVKALTDLVEVSRQFEMQARLMKSIQENADNANGIISL